MELNFPHYDFPIRTEGQRKIIFDRFRRKWVTLTPEEWVRQHLLVFLVEEYGYPMSLIAVEYVITVGRKLFRCDAVVFSQPGNPLLLVECKAPSVTLTQQTVDQISAYNMALGLNWLLLSNGLIHWMFRANFENKCLEPQGIIVPFSDL